MSRIFLAGAGGVIWRRLTPLLLTHGHSVWGTTRSPDKSEFVRKLGARPVVVDVFDAEALAAAMLEAKPEIVMHQLTDLAAVQDPAKRSRAQWAHPRRMNAQPRRRRAKGWRASADRAEYRLGLRAWRSTPSRRPFVGPQCEGRPAGERPGRRGPRGPSPRSLADGGRGASLWPAIRTRQRRGCAAEPAFGARRRGGSCRLARNRAWRAGAVQRNRYEDRTQGSQKRVWTAPCCRLTIARRGV